MTWLHLSDWHHGNKGIQDRALVRDALINDIENRTTGCDPRLEKLDFVFFTGDLAKLWSRGRIRRCAQRISGQGCGGRQYHSGPAFPCPRESRRRSDAPDIPA
jgi:3',5'-cyclic AMP phosphodiesterase CpdA